MSFAVPLPEGRPHAVEEYLAVAAALGARSGRVVFGLQASTTARRSVEQLLAASSALRSGPLIVVNPSASQPWKQWAAERWVRVIDELSNLGPVVLTGSPGQTRAHAAIANETTRRPVDLTGRTTLAELVALLERASLHVAPDTGTVHIAAALAVPVVAIYGPTQPWRVGPYGQPDGVVYHGEDGEGLAAVSPGEVIDKARAALRKGRASLRANLEHVASRDRIPAS